MNSINLKLRIKNKTFWLSFIPALLILVQAVAAVFGTHLDLGDLGNKLLTLVNTAFGLLAVMGVVVDHTTEGMGDSLQVMSYSEPKKRLPQNTQEDN